MLGLKRGTVELFPHEKAWEENAAETIERLKAIFGDAAADIQHVGSTSVAGIMAKPIIDIAVGIKGLDMLTPLVPALANAGFIRSKQDVPGDILFIVPGEEENTRTHHIHVVEYGGEKWNDYLAFRDYLNGSCDAAREYEALKLRLKDEFPDDRTAYTAGKADFIQKALRRARARSVLGKTVTVTVDRPLGSRHPRTDTIF